MKRTLKVVMEIDVEDLPADELKALWREGQEFLPDEEKTPVPESDIEDRKASEFSHIVECIGNEHMSQEFFGGSMIYAKFTDARVASIEFPDYDRTWGDFEKETAEDEGIVDHDPLGI